MKITKTQLKQIIKEELSMALNEERPDHMQVIQNAWQEVGSEIGIGEDGWEEAVVQKVIVALPKFKDHKPWLLHSLTYPGSEFADEDESQLDLLSYMNKPIRQLSPQLYPGKSQ